MENEPTAEGGGVGGVLKGFGNGVVKVGKGVWEGLKRSGKFLQTNPKFRTGLIIFLVLVAVAISIYFGKKALWKDKLGVEDWGAASGWGLLFMILGALGAAIGTGIVMNRICNNRISITDKVCKKGLLYNNIQK